MGLQSLPVAFGVDTAKYICVGTIDITQLGVAAYLWLGLNQPTYAAVLLGLILPQIFFQVGGGVNEAVACVWRCGVLGHGATLVTMTLNRG
jgi:chlorophyll synthase